MGISIFPAPATGSTNNDFVVDLNETSNNTGILSRIYPAGAYSFALSIGTAADVYFVNESGSAVGYTNTSSIVATGEFDTVVALGVSSSEVLTFSYNGDVTNTSSAGQELGVGAYLTSISPYDLPAVDDTATVTGGNFGTAVEIYFESGTVSSPAKQVARINSTSLIVTRPDVLSPELDPWDVRAVNPGIPEPTGTNANILAGTVDAGALPVWVTTSPLTAGTISSAFAGTVVATDADGSITYSITAGTLPTGLSLGTATGEIAGTPTGLGSTFTVLATDEGGNSNSREFFLPIVAATGGSVSIEPDGVYHIFETSDDFVALAEIATLDYVVVAGGGGGGLGRFQSAGGAGAGGYRATLGTASGGGSAVESAITVSAGTVVVTVGAGGNAGGPGNNGGDSSFGTAVVTVGGGRGGSIETSGSGGSGGGQPGSYGAGTGTLGEGHDGNLRASNFSGGGGGGAAGNNPVTVTTAGGPGIELAILGGTAAKGGNVQASPTAAVGYGSGGNSGSGTGSNSNTRAGSNGAAGIVVVRY